jgi:sugar lactone lactonase YvrE
MKIWLPFTALLALTLTAPLPAQEPPPAPATATEVQQLKRALTVAPDNVGFWVELAAAHARAGNKAEALRWIEKAVARGLDVDLAENPAFAPFQETPEFKNLVARAALNRRVVNRSKIAFRLPEKDLIPEGIAHDPKTGAFFVGSILKRKIVRIDKAGKVSDFKTSGQDGLWEVLGMEVDPETRTLWVCSAAGSAAAATDNASALFRFHVDTGKLLGKFMLPGQDQPHLCNDIALGRAGEVFLTDSKPGLVHRLRPGKDQIEVLVGPGTLYYPNGIAISPDFQKLFVADFGKGLSIVDVATGQVRNLPYPKNVIVAGIDGLYLHNGSLLAVQNGAGTRIMRFRLNAALDAIESEEILESRNPLFQIPTTGVPVGDSFFYIANSQLLALDDFGKLKPEAKLEESVVLELAL